MGSTHIIHEHVFMPAEAKEIYDTTISTGYNFREASMSNATNHIAEGMRQGEWVWTEANPIRLSSDWKLCSDGLHRLLACWVTKIPLRSLVLVGDEWKSGVNSDRGRSRTLAQFLANNKYTNATIKAAIVKNHAARCAAAEHGVSVAYASTVLVHDGTLIEYVKHHDAALSWTASRVPAASDRGFNASGYGVFLLQLHHIDPELAQEFHADVIGTPESIDDPVARLKNYVWKRFDVTGKRLNQAATTDSFVKCWELRQTGTRLKMWKPPLWDSVRFPVGYRPGMERQPSESRIAVA